MQQKYGHDATRQVSGSCPLKDKCPLYAAVVHGEGDVSMDSLRSVDMNWSQAAQSKYDVTCD